MLMVVIVGAGQRLVPTGTDWEGNQSRMGPLPTGFMAGVIGR